MMRHPAAAPRYAALLDPGTALLIAGGVGAATSALGSIQQGNAAASAGSYNAAALEARAATERDQAAAQAAIDQQNTRRQLGQAYANAGASGVDPGQGSPLSVMSDLASQGELTRRLSLYRGEVAATGDINQAGLARWQGRQAQQAGYVRAGSTLLTAAALYGMNSGGGVGGGTVGPSYSGATGPFGYNTPGGLRVGGGDYAF